nr:hypothetical protein HAGR004_13280 [Bdellovibrio sp. HAGR004]
MKRSIVLLFMLTPLSAQSETLTDGRPKDCSYSASVNGAARTLSVSCNDFDLNYKKTTAAPVSLKTAAGNTEISITTLKPANTNSLPAESAISA